MSALCTGVSSGIQVKAERAGSASLEARSLIIASRSE